MLTLNVWGLSYLGLTRSTSWLLMPWLLVSPGHQQPWYWLYRMGRSLSCLRKISTSCDISMWKNDMKCKYIFLFPLKNLACKGLSCPVWRGCMDGSLSTQMANNTYWIPMGYHPHEKRGLHALISSMGQQNCLVWTSDRLPLIWLLLGNCPELEAKIQLAAGWTLNGPGVGSCVQ